MENASKALLIAGGFLITILFLSLFAYLFTFMREYSSNKMEQMKSNEATQFNQQFLNYAGRNDLTIQDVVTIVNLAKDNNESISRPTTIVVTVGGANWAGYTEERLMNLIETNLTTKYTCASSGVEINRDTLLVTRDNNFTKHIKFCKDGKDYEKDINSYILHCMYNTSANIC